MKHILSKILFWSGFFCFMFSLHGWAPAVHAQTAEQIVAVVHPGANEKNLTLPELREIFLGNRVFWPDGKKIMLILPARDNNPTRKFLVEKLCGMTEYEFGRHWKVKVYRNEVSKSPLTAASDRIADSLVSRFKGSISLLSGPWALRDSHIVSIDGKKPGEKGYALTLP